MIRFDAFIRSIHAAILSANDALVDKNLDVLTRYFEETNGGDEFQRSLDEALNAINEVVGQEHRPRKEIFDKALGALKEVKEALSQKDACGTDSVQARFPDGLRPKMTTIQYPQQTCHYQNFPSCSQCMPCLNLPLNGCSSLKRVPTPKAVNAMSSEPSTDSF